jgi:YhcH/YjgK/YiaL family protein
MKIKMKKQEINCKWVVLHITVRFALEPPSAVLASGGPIRPYGPAGFEQMNAPLPETKGQNILYQGETMICAACNYLTIPEKHMNPNWEKALEWIRAEKWRNLGEGKTEIDGERVFVSRMKYTSKPIGECRYETHRIYADIQIVLKGAEMADVCGMNGLREIAPYSAEKDIAFFDGNPAIVHRVVLSFPLALVLFPEDAHKPSIAVGNPSEIEKVVFKVALQ